MNWTATIRDGGGTRHGPTRSEAMWWVIHEMMRRGYAFAAIEAVLLDHKNGISQHIYDQPEPCRYVRRQIAEAKKKIHLAIDEDKGKPYASPNNIRIALLKLGVTLRYDSFADRVIIKGLADFGPVLDDAAVLRLWVVFAQRFRLTLTRPWSVTSSWIRRGLKLPPCARLSRRSHVGWCQTRGWLADHLWRRQEGRLHARHRYALARGSGAACAAAGLQI